MSHYQTLEISNNATHDQIRAAYRRLALECHPDQNISNTEAATRRFQEISNAYDALRDPVRRAEYDEYLRSMPTQQLEIQGDVDAQRLFCEEFHELLSQIIQEVCQQGNENNVGSAVTWSITGGAAGYAFGLIVCAPLAVPAAVVVGGLGAIRGWTGRDICTVYSNLSPELKQEVQNRLRGKR